jgi:serine/threonine-protein kinase RsbW
VRRTRQFPHLTDSVPAARHFVAELVRALPAEDAAAIELMVSELATNCIRHARAGFALMVEVDEGQVRVEITDSGGGRPEPRSPEPLEPSGRGLRIVEAFADAWGVRPAESGHGKTVWFSRRVQQHARE